MPLPCTTFSLQAQLGFGCDRSGKEALEKACSVPKPVEKSLMESFTSQFFSSSSSSSNSNTTGNHHAQPNATTSAAATTTSENYRFFVASASHVELTVDERKQCTALVAVLVPPSLMDACLEKYTSMAKIHASGPCFWIRNENASAIALARDLLSSIHTSLISSKLLGVVRTSIASEENAPAEFILIQLPKSTTVQDVLQATNGQALNADSTAILKILPLSGVEFSITPNSTTSKKNTTTTSLPGTTTTTTTTTTSKESTPSSMTSVSSMWMMKSPPPPTKQKPPSIPTCAVCLHRIDPIRLGFPSPQNEHLCSKFCPPPNLLAASWTTVAERNCPKQRFLLPWSHGARCKACQNIQSYWDYHNNNNNNNNNRSHGASGGGYHHHDDDEDYYGSNLFCQECAINKTLWVCLTCGYVGCGRYSNRHSVKHFQETQHPYSLELATLRIWDYVHEDRFAHRVDLLECPSSPPLSQPWMARPSSSYTSAGRASSLHATTSSSMSASASLAAPGFFMSLPEKSPKKATMIGEEYEALLQSALEDQAQHYEGEITRLRAELTASLVDQTSLTPAEHEEMEQLRSDIAKLRTEIDVVSREVLDAQSQEVGHRTTSQRLLQEQQEANALIQRIEREAREEAYQGKLQVEDLEQQVQDLKANLRMRQRFSQNEELSKAQIFGTTTQDTSSPASNNNNNSSQAKASLKRGGKKKGTFSAQIKKVKSTKN